MSATFKFISDAVDKDLFDVTSFSGTEGLSQLYRYEIHVKALTKRVIDFVDDKSLEDFLDEMLDHTARLITEEGGVQYPVHGMLASFDENQTAGAYTYYTAVLVPRLWKLSIYRTNEIYTTEKTVDQILVTILDQFEFIDGEDYSMSLSGELMKKDYVCQFRESDFHFISRLMENEGIYYYFEQGENSERLMIVDGADYSALEKPDVLFNVNAQAVRRHESLFSWTRRTHRLPTHVSVRDYNPDQPSLDVHGTVDVETLSDTNDSGELTDYLYGDNFSNEEEAARLARLRAEEIACRKTRYYGEGAVCGFRPGYTFKMNQHPNPLYNGKDYLLIEVSHEGKGLDSKSDTNRSKESGPQYSNTFVAMENHLSFRPPRKTKKPRFFGTMTAFVYAEAATGMAEIDDQGRYRVHLPFDRAEGGKESSDPNRKASCWVRMAQPYVGDNQGMYFPLKNGTEVLLTFINGDPDQPIIAAALPNASTPSLLNSESNLARISTPNVFQQISGTLHTFVSGHNPGGGPATSGTHYINDPKNDVSMLPPWTETPGYDYDANLIKMKTYLNDFSIGTDDVGSSSDAYNSDRGSGDNYVYANARTFAYPQHERVYFIGTFHEDFHIKDGFTNSAQSYTGQSEVFHFPAPGGDGNQGTPQKTECQVNPTGMRGVSEDRRWGDQMFYSWGRIYTWSGGPGLGTGGAQEAINYGNGYTENLIEVQSYTLAQARAGIIPGNAPDKAHFDEYKCMNDDWIEFQLNTTCPDTIPNIATTIVGGVTALLKDQKYLDPSAASVERTFGSTYSYQMGYSVDIREGTSVSKQYGDDISYVDGNSYSTQIGDSTSFQHGCTTEYFLGRSHSYKLAGELEISAGSHFALSIAPLATDLSLGLQVELNLFPNFENNEFKALVTKFTAKKSGAEISSSEVTVEDDRAAIKTGLVAMRVADLEVAIAKGISVEQVNGLKVLG